MIGTFLLNVISAFIGGGSGKRLWLHSNNTRSKKFLLLLVKEDGTKESMEQRVIH